MEEPANPHTELAIMEDIQEVEMAQRMDIEVETLEMDPIRVDNPEMVLIQAAVLEMDPTLVEPLVMADKLMLRIQ